MCDGLWGESLALGTCHPLIGPCHPFIGMFCFSEALKADPMLLQWTRPVNWLEMNEQPPTPVSSDLCPQGFSTGFCGEVPIYPALWF